MEPICIWRLNISRGVPQRREKRFGNGVKNLSGSADIPKFLIIIIAKKEMLTRAILSLRPILEEC
jgi:hypothetical protein